MSFALKIKILVIILFSWSRNSFMTPRKKIGVFDSGIGGLTILKALMQQRPDCDYVYVADNKNVPYGNKSTEEIRTLSTHIVDFLLSQNIRSCIIACHTIGAVAQEYLQKKFEHIYFQSLIRPVVDYVVKSAVTKIAIFGTTATIATHAHKKALLDHAPHALIFEKECPGLALAIEQFYGQPDCLKETIKEYFFWTLEKEINCIVLACTHYPLVQSLIQEVVGNDTLLITGQERAGFLVPFNSHHEKITIPPRVDIFVTASPLYFKKTSDVFLTGYGATVEQIIL